MAWHLLGARADLLARVPFATKIDRHRIAVFLHDGRFHAISDICNHKGGPKPSHLLEAPPRALGISTTAMDEANPRWGWEEAAV